MKPKPVVQIQAALALAAALVAVALCGRAGALGVLVVDALGMALSSGLAIRYHRLVRARRRSAHRGLRDRIMTGCLLAGFVAPSLVAVLAVAGGVSDRHRSLDGVPAHFAVIAATAVFAVMLASSCVDWYLIRPFRDGALGPPACQTREHDDETALFYARAWIAHRAIAEIVGWGGSAIVLIVALVAIQQSTRDPTWAGIFTYLAPSGAVYLLIGGYLLRRLRPVPRYLQQPSPGLGRWVQGQVPDDAGNPRQVDGFLVDVALGAGLQVLSGPTRKPVFVPLARASELASAARPRCRDRCEGWLPGCERGLCEDEAGQRNTAPISDLAPSDGAGGEDF